MLSIDPKRMERQSYYRKRKDMGFSEKGFWLGDDHGLRSFKEIEELLLGLMDSFEFAENERVSIKKLI
jgi:hypothetical protein